MPTGRGERCTAHVDEQTHVLWQQGVQSLNTSQASGIAPEVIYLTQNTGFEQKNDTAIRLTIPWPEDSNAKTLGGGGGGTRFIGYGSSCSVPARSEPPSAGNIPAKKMLHMSS